MLKRSKGVSLEGKQRGENAVVTCSLLAPWPTNLL